MKRRIQRCCRENPTLIIFIRLMVCFRSALADCKSVPSESMKPTIVERDRILVNKMAYDIPIPLTDLFLQRRDDGLFRDLD